MKKVISLLLVFSILLLSGNMFAQGRKGAELIVRKKDGIPVRGELIAVKQDSLLLLKRESGADMTVKVGDISIIVIVKKSQLLAGAGFGTLLGAGVGALIGAAFKPDAGGGWGPSAGMVGMFIGGLAGIFIGVLGGMVLSKDKTIQFEGKSDSEIQDILEKLSKKARVRNSQ